MVASNSDVEIEPLDIIAQLSASACSKRRTRFHGIEDLQGVGFKQHGPSSLFDSAGDPDFDLDDANKRPT
jgi:hypothetical protein